MAINSVAVSIIYGVIGGNKFPRIRLTSLVNE